MPLDTLLAAPAEPAGRPHTDDAASLRRTARRAGVLYLVMSALMIFAFMYVPARFVVSGDAVATAARITAGEGLYRTGLLAALASHLLFVVVVLTLYRLFRTVDRELALLMVALVCVGVAAEIVNIANRAAPLVLLGGAEFLAPFDRGQLEALAMGFLRMASRQGQALTLIWGLWLFPFGLLMIRSGWFPRWLGMLLFASGAAYMATAVTSVVLPEHVAAVSRVVFPLYFAELVVIFWLVAVGTGRSSPAATPPA